MIDLGRLQSALLLTLSYDFRTCCRMIALPGCAYSDEVALLLQLFPSARITLIDQCSVPLRLVERKAAPFGKRVRVVTGSASKSSNLPANSYELVVIRHPDIAQHPTGWHLVVDKSVDALRTNGIVMVTTYDANEAAWIAKRCGNLGLEERDCITQSPVPLAGNDRYILAYEKHML